MNRNSTDPLNWFLLLGNQNKWLIAEKKIEQTGKRGTEREAQINVEYPHVCAVVESNYWVAHTSEF